MPTTSGTGSEVARGAIVIVDDRRKLGFHSVEPDAQGRHLRPRADPGPAPCLTAATGMDAIAHCMETFMAPAFNPPADGIALDGLERGWAHIERATRNGSDREARLNMMSASMQGAMAFQKGLGCCAQPEPQPGRREPPPAPRHAQRHVPAGGGALQRRGRVGVRKSAAWRRMAHAMGLASASDIPEAIRDMNARLGLPTGLAAMGVHARCV